MTQQEDILTQYYIDGGILFVFMDSGATWSLPLKNTYMV
jgi:hypothetical protein